MLDTLHLCSLNCQGLGQKEKRQRLFQWAKNQKTHILYAQETHFTKNTILSLKQEFSGDVYNSHGNSQSRGVSIFIKKELKYTIIDVHNDNDGRILLINIEIDENIFTLVNLYANNVEKNRNAFFKKVNNFIENYAIGILIVGGDLNDTLTCADRKYSISTQKTKKPVNSLKTLIKKHKLIDIWRDMNTNLRQYTWRRKNNISTASRIDYFLISTDIRSRIVKADIRPATISLLTTKQFH